MNTVRERGPFLTVMAVLYGLLTVSNLTKALQYWNNPEIGGIVVFGVRCESVVANLILGPLMRGRCAPEVVSPQEVAEVSTKEMRMWG